MDTLTKLRRQVTGRLDLQTKLRIAELPGIMHGMDLVALGRWHLAGQPVPSPHLVKQWVVISHGLRFKLRVLVETGTFRGKMVRAALPFFDEVHSIELDQALYLQARQRFEGHRKVRLYQGDSAEVLPRILQTIQQPCLFWLDGHFSGGITAWGDTETPIETEIDAILDHPVRDQVILVDDARYFKGQRNYPTLEQVRERVRSRQPRLQVEVRDDIIRIYPPR